MKTTTEIIAEISTVTEFQPIAGLSDRRAKVAHVLRSNEIEVSAATLNACEWSIDHGIISEDFTAVTTKAKMTSRLVRAAFGDAPAGQLAEIEKKTVAANWSL